MAKVLSRLSRWIQKTPDDLAGKTQSGEVIGIGVFSLDESVNSHLTGMRAGTLSTQRCPGPDVRALRDRVLGLLKTQMIPMLYSEDLPSGGLVAYVGMRHKERIYDPKQLV